MIDYMDDEMWNGERSTNGWSEKLPLTKLWEFLAFVLTILQVSLSLVLTALSHWSIFLDALPHHYTTRYSSKTKGNMLPGEKKKKQKKVVYLKLKAAFYPMVYTSKPRMRYPSTNPLAILLSI